jgi:hypothetical protein
MLPSHLRCRVQAERDLFLRTQGNPLDTPGNRILELLGADVVADNRGKDENDSDQ